MPAIEPRTLQRSAALAGGISLGYENLAIRIPMGYVALMIRNFKGKFAEPILQGRMVPKGFPANLAKVARRKLIMLDAAAFLETLNLPPGNRLEALKGDLAGKHSIRINDPWRVVFRWTDAGPEDVEIIDYQQPGRPNVATEQEFAHGKETSAGSSRRNPAGRISRSAQADTLRGRGRAECAAHPDRTHRARRKARYGRHRTAARQVLQDRRCVLDEHSGALRSRNGRRRARAADQEDRGLRGGVRAMLSADSTDDGGRSLGLKARLCAISI